MCLRFERVVFEAQPQWFVMENVPDAPIPHVEGYETWGTIVRDKWVGGVQPRPRRFSFGTRDGRPLDIEWAALMRPEAQGFLATIASDSGIAYEEKRRALTIVAGHGPLAGISVIRDSRRIPVKLGGSGRVKRSIGGDPRIPSSRDTARSKEHSAGVLPSSGSVLSIEDACEAMGLPRDFTAEMPFTMAGKRSIIGNGVPMAMGRAIAKAVKRATKE